MDTTRLDWVDPDLWEAAWKRAQAAYSNPVVAWPHARQFAVEAQSHRDRVRIATALERLVVARAPAKVSEAAAVEIAAAETAAAVEAVSEEAPQVEEAAKPAKPAKPATRTKHRHRG